MNMYTKRKTMLSSALGTINEGNTLNDEENSCERYNDIDEYPQSSST